MRILLAQRLVGHLTAFMIFPFTHTYLHIVQNTVFVLFNSMVVLLLDRLPHSLLRHSLWNASVLFISALVYHQLSEPYIRMDFQ